MADLSNPFRETDYCCGCGVVCYASDLDGGLCETCARVECPRCDGLGQPNDGSAICGDCGGEGFV